MCAKMSQLHAELTEQAADLGFKSIEDAEQHGYVIEYKGGRLVPTEELMKQAHEAWLKEKDSILEALHEMDTDLVELAETLSPKDYTNWTRTLERARKFIEEAHD